MEVETDMMDNYTTSDYCNCRRSQSCLWTVISIIGVLLAFVIGIIVGLTGFAFLIGAFTAIVAIAILLAVMLIVFLIIRFCNRCENNSNTRCENNCNCQRRF